MFHVRPIRKSPQARTRRGVTAVEFAIAAPVLLLFIFASIEFSRIIMMRHTLENAVYEGVRRGLRVNSTVDDVTEYVQALTRAGGIQNTAVTVELDADQVTVAASLDVAAESWVMPQFFLGRTLASSLTLERI